MFVVNSGTELISDLLCFALQCISFFFFFGFSRRWGKLYGNGKGKMVTVKERFFCFCGGYCFCLLGKCGLIERERERFITYALLLVTWASQREPMDLAAFCH